jgi:hypothetical protein
LAKRALCTDVYADLLLPGGERANAAEIVVNMLKMFDKEMRFFNCKKLLLRNFCSTIKKLLTGTYVEEKYREILQGNAKVIFYKKNIKIMVEIV